MDSTPARTIVRTACLLACFFVIVAQRAPFWRVPIINPDEAIWVTCGESLRAGDLPYRDFLEIKPPGIFYLYSAASIVTPWSTMAIRLFATLAHCGTVVFLVLIGERIRRPWGGYLAGWMFAMACSGNHPIDFQASESEIFVAFVSTVGLWAAVRFLDGGSPMWALGWGLCGFVGVSLKQPAALDFIAMGFGLLILAIPLRIGSSRTLAAVIFGILGVLVPLGLTLFWFSRLGILQDCLNAVYFIPRSQYKLPEQGGWQVFECWFELVRINPVVYGSGLFVAIATLLSMPFWFRRSTGHATIFMVCCLAMGSEGGAYLGGHPFAHYFIQSLPSHCLILGLLLAGLEIPLELPEFRQAARFQRMAVIFVALASGLPGFVGYVLPMMRGDDIASDSVMPEVGQFVGKITNPGDRVGMWGFAPQVYYFSKRLPACRDLVAGPMSGWNPVAQNEKAELRVSQEMRKLGLEDLKRHNPKAFVDLSNAGYMPLESFPELAEWVKANYRIVKSVDVTWWGNPPGKFLVWQRNQ